MRPLLVLFIFCLAGCQSNLSQSTELTPPKTSDLPLPKIKEIITEISREEVFIEITFSERMQRLPSAALPLVLTPNTPCKWQWQDATHLICTSYNSRTIKPATKYRLAVEEGLYSMEGKALPASQFDFESFRPKPQSLWIKRWLSPTKPELYVQFNIGIEPNSLQNNFSLKSKFGKSIAVDLEPSDNDITSERNAAWDKNSQWLLIPKQKLKRNTRYFLMWNAEVVSPLGVLPAKSSKKYIEKLSFKTYGQFTYLGRKCRGDDWSIEWTNTNCTPGNYVSLEFTTPIDGESLEACESEIEEKGFLFSVNERPGASIQIAPNFANETKQIGCLESVVDIFGRKLPAHTTIEVGATDYRQSIWHRQANEVITPEDQMTIDIHTLNKESFNLEIHEIDFENTFQASTPVVNSIRNEVLITDILFNQKQKPIQVSGTIKSPIRKWWHLDFSVQKSQYNVTMNSGRNQTTIFISDIYTNQPVKESKFTLIDLSELGDKEYQLKTNQFGLAFVKHNSNGAPFGTRNNFKIIFETGQQVAMNSYHQQKFETRGENFEYDGVSEGESVFWGITDKPIYRPGDRVNYTGYLRAINGTKLSLDSLEKNAFVYLEGDGFSCWKTNCNTIYKEEKVKQDPFGRISGQFVLPKSIKDGRYYLTLGSEKENRYNSDLLINVANYKRQDIEVKIQSSSIDYVNNQLEVSSEASYYSGGAYKDAPIEVSLSFQKSDAKSDFKNFPEYHFSPNNCEPCTSQRSYLFDLGKLDGFGKTEESIRLPSNDINYGEIVMLSTVTLNSGDTVLSRTKTVDYQPRNIFVGLKRKSWRQPINKKYTVEAVVVDIQDGKSTQYPISYFLKRWSYNVGYQAGNSSGSTNEPEEKPIKCIDQIKSSSCSFVPKEQGSFEIIARINYADGKSQETRLTQHFYGDVSEPKKEVSISTPNSELEIGEQAIVLVNHPYEDTRALITIHRGSIIDTWHQFIKKGENQITIPVKKSYAPGFDVTIQLYYDDLRKMDKSSTENYAPIVSQHFQVNYKKIAPLVAIKSNKTKYRPGETATIQLINRSDQESSILLALIDKSIITQTDNERYFDLDGSSLDPKLMYWQAPEFYELASRLYSSRITDDEKLRYLTDENRIVITGSRIRRQDVEVNSPANIINFEQLDFEGFSDSPLMQSIQAVGKISVKLSNIRRAFKDTAYWNPNLIVAVGQTESVDIKLPDNLTDWKIIAIATNRSGSITASDLSIKTQKDVEVRSEIPKQLTSGDSFYHKPYAIARKETIKKLSIAAVARESGSEKIIIEKTKSVLDVKPFERYSLSIPVHVDLIGSAEILSVVDAKDAESDRPYQDAIFQTIPIFDNTIIRTKTRYSILPNERTTRFEEPAFYSGSHAKMSFTLSGSLLSQLSATNEYMKNYPHQCWEQKSSRALVAALQLKSMNFKSEDKELLESNIQDAIDSFDSFQTSGGGMAFFGKSDDSVSLYLSAYTYLAITRLQKMGYQFSQFNLKQLERYLENLVSKGIKSNSDQRKPEQIKIAQKILILNALSSNPQTFDFIEKHLPEILNASSELDQLSKGLLIETTAKISAFQSVSRMLSRQLMENTRVTDKKRILVSEKKQPWYYYDFSAKKYCAIVSGLVAQSYDQKTVYQLINGALDQRRTSKGDFGNTLNNAYCALAISDYAEKYESVDSQGEYQIDIQGQQLQISEKHNNAASNLNLDKSLTVEIKKVSNEESNAYLISKLSYKVDASTLPAIVNGFSMQREYRVYKDRKWIKVNQSNVNQGDYVKVTLRINNSLFRRYIALTDKLPGGFFALDEKLANSAPHELFESLEQSFYFNEKQFATRNVKFYADYLPQGSYVMEYLVKAAHQGEFAALAAKVEDMYDDDVFGSTKAERITIH